MSNLSDVPPVHKAFAPPVSASGQGEVVREVEADSHDEEFRASPNALGNREVAGIRIVSTDLEISTRSGKPLVSSVLRKVFQGLSAYEHHADIVKIVESFAWPFIAHRSTRRGEWFSDVEKGRFEVSLRKTALTLFELANAENREQAFAKYWLNYHFAQVVGDLSPEGAPRDDWIQRPLFVGWCKRAIARAIARGDVSFIYSLQQSKRAWPALGEEAKKIALRKHAKRLGEIRGELPEDLGNCIRNTAASVFRGTCGRKEKVILQLQTDLVGNVFTREEFPYEVDRNRYAAPKPTKFMPSGSACLQASRQKGGALGLCEPFQFPTATDETTRKLGKLRSLTLSIDRWRQVTYAVFRSRAERQLQAEWRGLTQLGETTASEATMVEAIALPEPGKFRIITKGDAYLYTALQPLQGLMLEDWKRHFASTMLINDCEKRVVEMDAEASVLPLWCSVDYEAATDLLKKSSTVAALGALKGAPLFRLAQQAVLRDGVCFYPDLQEGDGEVPAVAVREGQLMGHPLSFPLLCVINLSVYRTAINRWVRSSHSKGQRTVRRAQAQIMRKNVLVNGDDMLFKCHASFYPIFIQTAADAGLNISKGKNYLTPYFAMINSQTFVRKGEKMVRVGYLNQQLLSGFAVKKGDGMTTPTMITPAVNDMVTRCPWANCAIPAIYGRWSSDWLGKRFQPNWYLPVHLGGYGLNPKFAPGGVIQVTKQQRLLAAWFLDDPALWIYRTRSDVRVPTAKYAGALLNWKLVSKTPEDIPAEEDATNRWLERICYAARATSGGQETPVSECNAMMRLMPRQYRLKPMSIEGLVLRWEAKWMATEAVPCPPIGPIKLHVLDRAGSPFVRSGDVVERLVISDH